MMLQERVIPDSDNENCVATGRQARSCGIGLFYLGGLEQSPESDGATKAPDSNSEGNLRATGQSKIEKTLEPSELQKLVDCLNSMAERAGFEPAVPARGTPVFETGPFNRSGTSPRSAFRAEEIPKDLRALVGKHAGCDRRTMVQPGVVENAIE